MAGVLIHVWNRLERWVRTKGLSPGAQSDQWNDQLAAAKAQPGARYLLHVGCGAATKLNTTKGFQSEDWHEIRLDIDPHVNPDIVGSMLDMSQVPDESIDAVFSSHNIEHLHFHEVRVALEEFRRVLKPSGFLCITCPDLQSLSLLIAEDKLLDTAYVSPRGPIAPIDILFGHRQELEAGNSYMAHKCGFTLTTLSAEATSAGFGANIGIRRDSHLDLWLLATIGKCSESVLRDLAAQHFPN